MNSNVESNKAAVSSLSVNTNTTKLRFVSCKVKKQRPDDILSYIDLRIFILEDPGINVVSLQVIKVQRTRVVRCPLGLQEEDFLSQLRSIFPQLAGDAPFELLWTDHSRELKPLNVTKLTPEEINRSICSVGSGPSTVYVRLKEKKKSPDDEDASDEDNRIRLRMFLIMNPNISFCPKKALKSLQSTAVRYPLGLQEEDFLSQLRSIFPDLAGDIPFELFWIGDNRKLMPLNLTRRTPEEIHRFISSAGNKDSALYIQLKKEEVESTEEEPKQDAEQSRIKKEYLMFKVRIVEDPKTTSLHQMQSHMASKLRRFKSRADLDVFGFRRLLKTRFPKLQNRMFDFFKCNTQRDLVPLSVDRKTPENIYRALSSATLYIRVKEPSEKTVFRGSSRKRRRAAAKARAQNRAAIALLQQHEDEINRNGSDDEGDENDEGVGESEPLSDNNGDDSDNDTNMEKGEEDGDEQTAGRSDHNVTNGDAEEATAVKDSDSDMETQNSWLQPLAKSMVGFSCKVCGALQRKKSLLTKHALGHVDDPSGVCGVCGKCFPSAETLRKHLPSHHQIHVCDTCGKSFVALCGLQKHNTLHSDERPYSCPICDKTFALKSVMKTHLRFHEEHRVFRCNCCHKTFATKLQLRIHTMTHSSERPYPCSVCGKALKSLHSLSMHITSHSGHRPTDKTYVCEVCSMKLYSQEHLNTHMETHQK